ncbi:hypothetical protein F5888DRAFT_1812628 [Russula emetica]|nr:hypothetical protein F5888DRAFT_1812628 [Russula emetica]
MTSHQRSVYYDELCDTFQARAVEVIPLSVELWFALARLETPGKGERGRLIEQEAYAAELSEEKRIERVDKTLATAVRTLLIESATVAMDVDEEDRFTTWLGDTEAAEARGRVGTARAVLAFTLRVFPDCRDLWRRAADLEKAHGTHESLDKLLARAEKWLGGDVRAAREVPERAFVRNLESEQIWLAAVKLEAENGELAVARELLVRARTVADTERIWLKSAVFERQQGRSELTLKIVTTALSKHTNTRHLQTRRGGREESIRARALLEKARLVNPKSDVLWAEAVRVEERSGAPAQGKALLARALQECLPNIWHALVYGDLADPLVICTVAWLYWADRRIEKAREWFERAVSAGPDLGNAWGWWLKFERQHGTAAQ